MYDEARSRGWKLWLDVEVDLADLVRRAGRRRGPGAIRMRVRVGAIGLKDARPTGVVITLIRGHHEERVALVDAVVREAGEEGGKGIVVSLELCLRIGLARPGCSRETRVERCGKR